MVELLLAEGVEAHVRTNERQLTCYHLLMMRPRDEETLRKALELLFSCKLLIEFDAKETTCSLTAHHMAVRNRNFYGVKRLLEMGAEKKIPVTDQLKLLSSGVRGYLGQVKYHPRLFTNQITILGEAVAQYIQDGYYKPQYIAALLDAFLGKDDGILSLEDTPIDGGSNISLLQLLSIIHFPTPDRSVCAWNRSTTDDSDNEDIPVVSNFECLSLLQKALDRTPVSLTNTRDLHGDTPLHYACAACEIHSIEALLSAGADPHVQNNFGLRPIEVLCCTRIFCGGRSFRVKFNTEQRGLSLSRQREMIENQMKEEIIHEGYVLGTRRAFSIFEDSGCVVDARLERLALAWEVLKEGYVWEERALGVKRMNDLKEEPGDEKDRKHVKNDNVDEEGFVGKYICKIFLEPSRY